MNKKKIVKGWVEKNGCAKFNLKDKSVDFFDGGLFAIESKKVKRHKITGYKKLPNGCVEILFSKKKLVKDIESHANLWFEDIDDTINYFKRMKKMLNKLGYKTSHGKIKLKSKLNKTKYYS